MRKSKPWITEEEVEELIQQLNESQEKINNIHETLKETPLNEDSIHRNKDMLKQAEMKKDKFFALKGKTKPKGWKDEKQ